MRVTKLFFWGMLFCAVLVYVLLFEQNAPRRETPPQKQLNKVFNFSADELQGIEIIRGDSRVSLTRPQTMWELSYPPLGKINQESVDSLVSAMIDLVKIEMVSHGASDLTQYGLERPGTTVSLRLKGSTKPVTLQLGTDNPAGLSMYAMLQGSNEVIQIGTLLRFSINTFMDRCLKDKGQ